MVKKFNKSFTSLTEYSKFAMKCLRLQDNVAMKVKFRKTFNSSGNNAVYHMNGWYIRNPKEGK